MAIWDFKLVPTKHTVRLFLILSQTNRYLYEIRGILSQHFENIKSIQANK